MNKFIERDKKMSLYKRLSVVFTATVLIAGGGVYTYRHFQNTAPLSVESQRSLIEVETEAVKSNAKPLQVKGSIMREWKRLNKSNRALAADIVYTSVQNSAVYYNSAVLLMEGEITYNQTKNNSLSAADSSAWVLGFIQDIENNSLKSYNMNKFRILVLPDFEELYDELRDGASSELKDFLKIASRTQSYKVFTDDKVDVRKSAEVYQAIIDGTAIFARNYPNSKYLQDLSSLARIYHDVTFGYVQTNNLELQADGSYKLTKEHIKALSEIAKGDGALASEAQSYLEQLEGDTISADYLKSGSDDSLQLYGSNVFWQNDTDLRAILEGDGTVDLANEPKKEVADGQEKKE